MSQGQRGFSCRYREWVFSSLSAGFFFVLVGAIFVSTPNLFNEIIAFFDDISLNQVGTLPVYLPSPMHPQHQIVYGAIVQFSFVWAIYQIVILALRYVACSPLSKRGETLSNAVFWFGIAYAVEKMLIETTKWFEFWAVFLVILGLSLVARAIYLGIASQIRYQVFH